MLHLFHSKTSKEYDPNATYTNKHAQNGTLKQAFHGNVGINPRNKQKGCSKLYAPHHAQFYVFTASHHHYFLSIFSSSVSDSHLTATGRYCSLFTVQHLWHKMSIITTFSKKSPMIIKSFPVTVTINVD